jgi:hypothetical protein
MLDPQELFGSVVTLSALFASIAWCLARPNLASMLSTLGLAVLWPFVDTPLNGRLLMVLSDEKGVTQSDLISAFAVVIVAIQVARPIVKDRWPTSAPEQTDPEQTSA